jgi:hypothetical protein
MLTNDTQKLNLIGLKNGATVVLLVRPPKTQQLTETSQSVPPELPNVQQEVPNVQQEVPNIASIQPQLQNLQSSFANILQQNPEMFMEMLLRDPEIQQMAQADPQGLCN